MAMNMERAFNSRMETKMVRLVTSAGSYDANNVWIPGVKTNSTFFGVLTVGNKYSQFDEGIGVKATEGGERNPNWRLLYVKGRWGEFSMGDYILYKGKYHKIIQKSDEETFNFYSYLAEELKDYQP